MSQKLHLHLHSQIKQLYTTDGIYFVQGNHENKQLVDWLLNSPYVANRNIIFYESEADIKYIIEQNSYDVYPYSINDDYIPLLPNKQCIFGQQGADLRQLQKLYQNIQDKYTVVNMLQSLKMFPNKIIEVCHGIDDLNTKVEEIPFPYVIKHIAGKGGKGNMVVRSASDKQKALEDVGSSYFQEKLEFNVSEHTFLIEQYITEKVDININFFISGNTVEITGGSEQITDLVYYRGNRRDKKVQDMVQSLNTKVRQIALEMQNIGYLGYAGIDFMVTQQGQQYFNEINARMNSSTIFNTMCTRYGRSSAELRLFRCQSALRSEILIKDLLDLQSASGCVVLPYEVNREKGSLILLFASHITSDTLAWLDGRGYALI